MEWTYSSIGSFSLSNAEEVYCNLSESRKNRIDRFKKSEDRLRSLLGEYLVKKLLRETYGIRNAVIECAENGRPFLKGIPLFISISHSNELVVCAVDDKPIGIDVEKLKPINLKMIDRVCVDEEKEYVLNGRDHPTNEVTDQETIARFFEIWTGKEAYFKAVGTGITDLKTVNVLKLERTVIHIDEYLVQIV